MAQSPLEDIRHLFQSHTNYLLATGKEPTTDAIAAVLGIGNFLNKSGKKATVVANQKDIVAALTAPTAPVAVVAADELQSGGRFVIEVDVTSTKVEELSYGVEGDTLRIYLKPKIGQFTEENVRTTTEIFDFDCIITIGASSLNDLSAIFADRREFFFSTPLINIDNKPSNENFGQVNHVDIAATTLAELAYGIINTLAPQHIDAVIATNLLEGIMCETNFFRTARLTPTTLTTAARLMESGGKHAAIIQRLHQTKSIDLLQLWGAALRSLHTEHNGELLWATLNRQTLLQHEACFENLHHLIDELLVHMPRATVVALLYEHPRSNVSEAFFSTKPHLNSNDIFQSFKPTRRHNVLHHVFPDKNIHAVEELLKKEVGTYLRA